MQTCTPNGAAMRSDGNGIGVSERIARIRRRGCLGFGARCVLRKHVFRSFGGIISTATMQQNVIQSCERQNIIRWKSKTLFRPIGLKNQKTE